MPRKRTYCRYCIIISEGPLAIVRLPEVPIRWSILCTKLAQALKRNHGTRRTDIISIDGLLGAPEGDTDPDDIKALARLEMAYEGDPEPYKKFSLYDWDTESETFFIKRGNTA